MKNILIISAFFEPSSLVGAKRMSYFANFLKKYANISVIKLSNSFYSNISNKKLDDSLKIYEIESNYKNKYMQFFNWLNWKNKIEYVIKKENIDLLIFSGGPFFYFTLAPIIKMKYNINYVLDFRDPWFININYKSKKSLKDKIKIKAEKYPVEKASLIINVTSSLTEKYEKTYGNNDSGKFITVYNGYDESRLNKIIKKINVDFETFKLGIFGKFSYYKKSDVSILCSGIKKLSNKIQIKVYHIGRKEEYFIKQVKKYGLENQFKFCGIKDYKDGINFLQEMNALILNNRSKDALGTKIFDYLYLNKPILGFVDDNYLIDSFLSQYNNYFNVRSEERFVKALEKIKKKRILHLDYDLENKNLYSRKSQSEKLLNYLEDIF